MNAKRNSAKAIDWLSATNDHKSPHHGEILGGYLLASIFAVVLVWLAGVGTSTQVATTPLWYASYWNNTALAGPPVLEQFENAVDYNWGTGSPHAAVDDDYFSVRWIGDFQFQPALYRFAATSDDGIRVWIDGQLIIDRWFDHPVETYTGDKYLSAGYHRLVVEYYEHESGAIVQLWWAPAPPADGPTWHGEYFNNPTLSGEPALVRSDPQIGFNWATNPPGLGVRADEFSARWTRTLDLPAGTYRFTMLVDDGGRLWVNDRLLIDAWTVQSPRLYVDEVYVLGGPTQVKMEYFDDQLGAMAHLSWSQVPQWTDYTSLDVNLQDA